MMDWKINLPSIGPFGNSTAIAGSLDATGYVAPVMIYGHGGGDKIIGSAGSDYVNAYPQTTTPQGGSMYSIKSRFKSLVTAAALLLSTAPVLAEQYVLEKGKGVEVCEAYKKNLESFSDRYPVIACERKINPAFTDFEAPYWEKLDLEKHRELFRRLLRYQGPDRNQFGGGYKVEDPDLDSEIKDHKRRGYPYVSHTNWNITPSGKRTSDILIHGEKMGGILIYRRSGCPDGPPFHESNIYALTDAPGVQDAIIDATSPLEKALRTEISPNNGGYASVGIFRHKGIAYIDKYCLAGNKFSGCSAKDTLIVYKYGSARNPNPKSKSVLDEYTTGFHMICEYRYLN